MRIGLGILFIGFKCELLSFLQALAYLSQDARRIPGVTNAAWLVTPSVRVNPSSQRAWRTPLNNSSAQRQLESLSPHGLGSLLDQ